MWHANNTAGEDGAAQIGVEGISLERVGVYPRRPRARWRAAVGARQADEAPRTCLIREVLVWSLGRYVEYRRAAGQGSSGPQASVGSAPLLRN